MTYSSGPEGISSPMGILKYSELKFPVLEFEVQLSVEREENLGVHKEKRGSYTVRI